MKLLTRGLLGWMLVAVGSLAGEPAAGDWLVTRDGAAVETDGAWKVKGSMVVFHTPAGVFSSMRLDGVDLEASQARTERAKAAAEAARNKPAAVPEPKKKATFVLTDAEVGHVDPTTLPDPRLRVALDESDDGAAVTAAPTQVEGTIDDEASAPAAKSTSAADGEFAGPEESPLEVVSWNATVGVGADGVVISGVVRNPTEYFATDVTVTIRLLDLTGDLIADGVATLEEQALRPGAQTAFERMFVGIFSVGDATFETSSFNAVVAAGESP